SGSTADLTSGTTRLVTATIYDLNDNLVDSDRKSAVEVTFAKDAGAGNVSGLGTQAATAGVATKTVTGTTAGSVTLKGTSGAVAAGALLTFAVTHGGADHIDLTGSTADLTSGTTRLVTATIYDLNDNLVDSGPDATLVVTFAKDEIGRTASRQGSQAATGGVASKTVTGTTAGSVTLKGPSGAVAAGALLTCAVTHGVPDHIDLTGSTADLTSGTTRLVTATIYDLNDNLVDSGPDATLVVTFAKD